METSNSSLSPEHPPLEFDSQEFDSDDQGIIKRILLLNQFSMTKKEFVPRNFFS
jgi:hypothetical protein